MESGSGPGRASAGRASRFLTVLALIALSALGPGAGSGLANTPSTANRYSIANGCYGLQSLANGKFVVKSGGGYTAGAAAVGGGERFRMEATDLGRFAFYGTAGDYLMLSGGSISPATTPGDGADWTVIKEGSAFRIYNVFASKDLAVGATGALVPVDRGTSGAAGRFAFVAGAGCPRYPEIDVNVKGAPLRHHPPYVETRGTIDAHMHQMAYEFLGGEAHCGKPWDRFGAPFALVDCVDHTASGGCGAAMENFLYGNPARCHDTVGWPTFRDWPDPHSLTHEDNYYKWIERSWRSGQRIFVNLLVENRVLCEVYPLKHTNCNEMDTARREAQRMYELQRYIDAQNGGPGKGWYRIVRSPFQARRVINKGKLAVVMGLEISEPFGCGLWMGEALCDSNDIDRELNELYRLGVRQAELVNKFDNALTGVAGDNGNFGVLTNAGNAYATGRFWDLRTCEDPDNTDRTPTAVYVHNDDALIANGFAAYLPPGTAPVYGEGPYCNARGLSSLGEHTIRRMMGKGMIFDPDHMSVLARNQAMNLLESKHYSGVISSHSWSTPNTPPRIYKLGGMLTPYAGSSEGFVNAWRAMRAARRGHQYFGMGYGADMNGFGAQGGPRGAGVPNPVTYPFRSPSGAMVGQQHSGERVYDINVDGVAHYGLYPDWLQDLRMIAGKPIIDDMQRGAEAYLQMWERAVGVPRRQCRLWRGRFTGRGFDDGRLLLGHGADQTLFDAGQPMRRQRSWTWCAKAKDGKGKNEIVAVFSRLRKIELIMSGMPVNEAAGVGAGDSAKDLKGFAEPIGKGVYIHKIAGGKSFVWKVSGDQVVASGVATHALTHSPKLLRSHVALSGLN